MPGESGAGAEEPDARMGGRIATRTEKGSPAAGSCVMWRGGFGKTGQRKTRDAFHVILCLHFLGEHVSI